MSNLGVHRVSTDFFGHEIEKELAGSGIQKSANFGDPDYPVCGVNEGEGETVGNSLCNLIKVVLKLAVEHVNFDSGMPFCELAKALH